MNEFEKVEADTYLRRLGLLNETMKGNDHLLHYEQVFGNAFERRESKCCAVLMKHQRKGNGEHAITLQVAQQLKTKN